ncbi:MAG: lysophospholipid acyltransferase family protein [Desulfobacterales bacterium]|jgi:1-acyl-sn-glycerol-3-phosphate acyltransferase|nr:lysophospholipid acyltransferase family protein [Desulfobacteraceae bacterium]MDD3990638.1 lysophospholipid acyltransferase family protein [Desulfobacteraceae bacterium]MDY0311527.1 lysophospholipid acyltransferase family protein [Desulfobacterales bacterium]
MINRVIAFFFLTYIAVTSVIFFVIALVIWALTSPFDRRLVVLHQFTSFWACLYLWTMPAWRVSLEGREKIRRRETYLIVSNHQSQLDILVAFRLFFPFKWVSKAEVFNLPFVGWNMALNQYVKLRRGDKESVARMMAACRRHLARGSSVFFFPEGTRSRDGALKPFKPGAFVLAHEMRLPILPIAIDGTRHALPKYSLNFHGRHHIRLRVLDPIAYSVFKHLNPPATAEMVRNTIATHVSGGLAR